METDDDLAELLGRDSFHARDARSVGLSAGRLAREVEAGSLVRIRRGHYVGADAWHRATDNERHRLVVRAAADDMPGSVFSHASAAAIWGLPLIGARARPVEVLTPRRSGGRSKPGTVRRWTTSEPRAVELDGCVVTGCARTVVDVARSATFVSGLAAADDALRRRLVTAAELAATVAELGRVSGVRAARRVVEHADGRAESVGESLSRGRMIEIGVPRPVLQQKLGDGHGVIGRVDFWWPELGLAGEFDGRVKYRLDGVEDGRPLEDRLWAEKAREDRLRAAGVRVARWTWDVAMDRRRFASHLAQHGLRPV